MSPQLSSISDLTSLDDSSESEKHVPNPRRTAQTMHSSVDQFGLEHPPPPWKLYDGDNINPVTGRREYFEDDVDLLPFHHEPTSYLRATRRIAPTSYASVHEAIENETNALVQKSFREGVDVGPKIRRLQDLERFANTTCTMRATRRWTLEVRMEELLVEYGYDKMKPPIRKRSSVEPAQLYVPYPNGKDVDCQRSAGTSPRKDLDEMMA
ncbi:MAG: hypothetical protein Q9182_003907 [Xanthomendoza sp. 2 TL-2023]